MDSRLNTQFDVVFQRPPQETKNLFFRRLARETLSRADIFALRIDILDFNNMVRVKLIHVKHSAIWIGKRKCDIFVTPDLQLPF